MLTKPPSCAGCALADLGAGFMKATGTGKLGVVLVGESLGEDEAEQGVPFVGRAGNILNNALARAGIDRGDLLILNAVWCQPPDNKLLGKPYYTPATLHCRTAHLDPAIRAAKPKVIVALGRVPMESLVGDTSAISDARGYPVWSSKYNAWVLPTLHPSYIARGNFPEEAFLIHDLQRAVEIAKDGWQFKWGTYLLDPTPSEALAWAKAELALNPAYVSADIETPRKGKKEDQADLGDATYIIQRISFSLRPYTGMSIPWTPPYFAAIRLLLENQIDKVFWNKAYDVPRIRANGVKVLGRIIDGMIAWHVLNTDLPKDLGTVATVLCPDQPRWKHMDHTNPPFYNACDSDVAGRCTLKAFEELKAAGLWEVYQRQVLRAGQVGEKMSVAGMPLDAERRFEYAKRLAAEREVVAAELERVTPFEIRPKFVYKTPPRADERESKGLVHVGSREVPVCPNCGYERPAKTHFSRATVKNPDRRCNGFAPVLKDVGVWARLLPLKVSHKLIEAYQDHVGHPKQFKGRGEDRKVTTDENSIRTLLLRFPDDPFYPVTLQISKLRKLQGTYVGYVREVEVPDDYELQAGERWLQ